MQDRLRTQLQFLLEIDKVKHIFRRTRLLDNSRYENDAEHGWHLAMMALILHEHAAEHVDIPKVIKMVLVHDIVEIDAGDTFLYDTELQAQKEAKEKKAAERIFGMLPEDQGRELKALWEEFEERQTPEARFAAALDRLEPLIQNACTHGHTWQKHDIRESQVLEANGPSIEGGSPALWDYAKGLISEAVEKGHLRR